jgi:hypothetical protein
MEPQKPILKAYGLGVNMNLPEQIFEYYPELVNKDLQREGIYLQNDSDGFGDYIREWNYSKPLPAGMKVGKN